MRITILGSGGTSGTPAIDLGWGRCNPDNPRNRRTRPAILVEDGPTRILVDSPPDLREQLLAARVSTLNAVLYTHAHADHLHGIDDLRAINRARNAPLDVYADAQTLEVIRERFGYVLEPLPKAARSYYKPTLIPREVKDGDLFSIDGIDIRAFAQDHGFSTTLGFRFGPAGYTTDVVELSAAAFGFLAGVRLWIIGTLIDHPHPTHCDVDKALAWIDRIGPERAVLTHLGNDLDYAALAGRLPPGVEPAFDGMVLDVSHG
jgi:phosphoribosyl 1,2-cyclic phosphate phosphodiesterase